MSDYPCEFLLCSLGKGHGGDCNFVIEEDFGSLGPKVGEIWCRHGDAVRVRIRCLWSRIGANGAQTRSVSTSDREGFVLQYPLLTFLNEFEHD